MKGHEFQSGRRLQDWVEHEMSHLAAKEDETALGNRNLSLRAPSAVHLVLARIAEKLSRSKSALSEEILTHTVRDVYRQFGLPDLTRGEVEEFAADGDKAPAEKPGGSAGTDVPRK